MHLKDLFKNNSNDNLPELFKINEKPVWDKSFNGVNNVSVNQGGTKDIWDAFNWKVLGNSEGTFYADNFKGNKDWDKIKFITSGSTSEDYKNVIAYEVITLPNYFSQITKGEYKGFKVLDKVCCPIPIIKDPKNPYRGDCFPLEIDFWKSEDTNLYIKKENNSFNIYDNKNCEGNPIYKYSYNSMYLLLQGAGGGGGGSYCWALDVQSGSGGGGGAFVFCCISLSKLLTEANQLLHISCGLGGDASKSEGDNPSKQASTGQTGTDTIISIIKNGGESVILNCHGGHGGHSGWHGLDSRGQQPGGMGGTIEINAAYKTYCKCFIKADGAAGGCSSKRVSGGIFGGAAGGGNGGGFNSETFNIEILNNYPTINKIRGFSGTSQRPAGKVAFGYGCLALGSGETKTFRTTGGGGGCGFLSCLQFKNPSYSDAEDFDSDNNFPGGFGGGGMGGHRNLTTTGNIGKKDHAGFIGILKVK